MQSNASNSALFPLLVKGKDTKCRLNYTVKFSAYRSSHGSGLTSTNPVLNNSHCTDRVNEEWRPKWQTILSRSTCTLRKCTALFSLPYHMHAYSRHGYGDTRYQFALQNRPTFNWTSLRWSSVYSDLNVTACICCWAPATVDRNIPGNSHTTGPRSAVSAAKFADVAFGAVSLRPMLGQTDQTDKRMDTRSFHRRYYMWAVLTR